MEAPVTERPLSSSFRGRADSLVEQVDRFYRRSGANIPFGDPVPSHGAEMEGYFWRITDVDQERVVVVLCGVNRHADGDWATVALATEPGGFVKSAVLSNAHASTDQFLVEAGNGEFLATATGLRLDLGQGARASLDFTETFAWPRPLGGGGIFSAVPFLSQYWQPHVLDGLATGHVSTGDGTWTIAESQVYAEKNWGSGFPLRWWWGQAHGFERRDVCVAFGGGLLTAGPVSRSVSGVVVRIGDEVIRLTPPFARVHCETDGHTWEVDAKGHGYRVTIRGADQRAPHALPVPLPAQRRNVETDFQHLAGTMTLTVSGRTKFHGTSHLAGLEIGSRPE